MGCHGYTFEFSFLFRCASLSRRALVINVLSNHLICPVYSVQQLLNLIKHHPHTHLLIPIHPFIKRCVAMCTALAFLSKMYIFTWTAGASGLVWRQQTSVKPNSKVIHCSQGADLSMRAHNLE